MADSETNDKSMWLWRLVVGALLFIFVVLIHVLISKLEWYLLATPGLVMGVKVEELAKRVLGTNKDNRG